MATRFSGEQFYVTGQTVFYSLLLVLLLAGIKKKTGNMLTMEIKIALQRMIEERGLITRGEIISGTSGAQNVIFDKRKSSTRILGKNNTEFRSQNSEDRGRAILNSEFCLLNSFISLPLFSQENQNKEEAYRSKESTPKFLLQKW